MVVKLFGASFSGHTLRVAMVMQEYNVPFELIKVDMVQGEHQSDAYLNNHPFGQVPYIDDDGFILYESRAISWYIATKYRDNIKAPLLPDMYKDTKKYAIFEQAASVNECHWERYTTKMVRQLLIEPMFDNEPDERVVEESLQCLNNTFDVYDRILSRQKYLAGDVSTIKVGAEIDSVANGAFQDFTLVDIFHLHTFHVFSSKALISTEGRPNVERYDFSSA
ncbi:hypothetical protein EIP91_007002 [Steccherinum ochraceum]|uniref:glutathione transferase n=1 Tax=Steccherinum ochraceum TaxID=92696 RepID=A0A4R0RLI6_9APHY|nr:hypothetical protein EIP91_007002 [Steccherinum ochraceum]